MISIYGPTIQGFGEFQGLVSSWIADFSEGSMTADDMASAPGDLLQVIGLYLAELACDRTDLWALLPVSFLQTFFANQAIQRKFIKTNGRVALRNLGINLSPLGGHHV